MSLSQDAVIFIFFHHFGGAALVYTAPPAVSPGILCVSWSEPHITNSFQAAGVVMGARNLSNSRSRSRRSTSKLTHNDQGSVL